jgi:NAD(P)H-flavin reductase
MTTETAADVAEVSTAMTPLLYRIQRVHKETYDTFTIELVPKDGAGISPFGPGQFNMLYVFGVGEVPISISGDPGDPGVLVHTTRAVGTVTRALRTLKPGDTVGVRGPFGVPWPVQESAGNDIVIMAGGIGLAPLRSAIYDIFRHREKYGKAIILYGARTPEDLVFSKEFERWRTRFKFDVHVTVDRATGSWQGNVGVVTTLLRKVSLDPLNTVALVCGPEVMMHFATRELAKAGLSDNNIVLSMERNMKCGIGLCGHCQFGPLFICKDGPVFRLNQIQDLLAKWEI